MSKKRVQTEPKSKLGFSDKLKICYNCCFYQKTGWCPFENQYMNYNDHCITLLKGWPSTFFRYKFNLPYKLEELKH